MHNQLLPNVTTLEKDIDQVGLAGAGNQVTVGGAEAQVSWNGDLGPLSPHGVDDSCCPLPRAGALSPAAWAIFSAVHWGPGYLPQGPP